MQPPTPPVTESIVERLNPNVVGLKPSATVAINDRSNALRRAGRDIVKLGLGQSPFPVPESVVAALRTSAAEKDYLPVTGLYALRQAVALHYRNTYDIDCSAEDVLIGPGSKELMFLLQLTYDGDLIIPSPSWVSYAPQARVVGRAIQAIPTKFETEWLVSPGQLDALCAKRERARLLVLNYPSNPTGRTYGEPELEALAEVARRHRVLLLSDEIYGKLHHDGEHRSIVPYYPEGTILSTGLSKWCGAGGWRLGIFVFPRGLTWLRDAMAAVASETYTSTSAPIQHAAVQAFTPDVSIDRYLVDARRVLRSIGNALAGIIGGTGARLLPAEGGFYLFPDFSPLRAPLAARGILTSHELCEQLLEDTGVAMLPGSEFGRPPDELTVRIAFVDFDGRAALAAAAGIPPGVALDDAFARRVAPRTILGAERVAEWIAR